MKDKKLLRAVKGSIRGNEQAFSDLISMRGRNILYIALSIMDTRPDGEDAAQDAIVAIKRDIVKLKKPELFDVWMYRVVFNTCMDAKKKIKRTATYLDPDALQDIVAEGRRDYIPESRLQSEETLRELSAAIKDLPERYRLCLLLYYYDDMSYEEIASVLNIQVHDVANTLNRAKKKLRTTVGDPDAIIEEDPRIASADSGSALGGIAYAGAPAMAVAFEIDERQTVTQAMLDRLVEAAAQPFNLTPAAALAALLSSAGMKVVAGAVIAAAVIGLTGTLVFGGGALGGAFPGLDPTGNPAQTAAPAPGKGDPEAIPLAEVLPPAAAAELEALGEAPQPRQAWEEFVAGNELLYMHYLLDSDYQYTVYLYTNAENGTSLIAIEREDNAGAVEVAYSTGGKDAAVPVDAAIAEAFAAWKSG